MAHTVRMTSICKSFSDVPVLRKVDLEVEPGTVHALVGENGAGKSTLCKILAGFYSRESGEITIKLSRV